jgi:hypothetical protein
MRATALTILHLLAVTAMAEAQTTPRWSLGGTLFGVTYTSESKSVDAGLPGGGLLMFAGASDVRAAPQIYAGFFPHPQIVVAPGIAFAYSSPEAGDSRYGLGLDLAIEWHFSGVTRNSLYAAASGAFLAWDLGAAQSTTDFAAGAALGYRFLPYGFFGLRLEGVYRRYFDIEENQVTGVIKAEVIFR